MRRLNPNEVVEWQRRETDALNEKIDRERRLLEDFHERERRNQRGHSLAQKRRYRVGPQTPTTQPGSNR
jgi:hypothetical protein